MDKTKYAYDISAEKYEEKFSKNKTYREMIERFSNLFNESSSILDIGCGPGLNAAVFSGKKMRVTGVDISGEMVKLARKNCPEGSFYVSSVTDFETENKFDGICLSFIIVHLETEDTLKLLERVTGMLKSEGKVYISFMTGKKKGYEKTSFSENEIFFNYYDKDYIISVFERNNFRPFSVNTAPYAETDGSFTEDVFMVFEQMKK